MKRLSDIKGLLPERAIILESQYAPDYCQAEKKEFNRAIDLMDKTIDEDRLVEIILPYIRGIYGYTFARANSKAEMMCEDYDIDFLDKQTEELANQIISKMPEWIVKGE